MVFDVHLHFIYFVSILCWVFSHLILKSVICQTYVKMLYIKAQK